MDTFIFDAGPLTTTCKFYVNDQPIIDHILTYCKVIIARSVCEEVIVAGAGYPDARIAQQRIEQNRLVVLTPTENYELESLIAVYNLGKGERDAILLANQVNLQDAILVIDDHLAYLVSARLKKQQPCFLLDVFIDLVKTKQMDKSLAIKIVKAIRLRYPPAFVEHTLLVLER